ncbi:sensor histidine kinase [Nocardioides sp.]|uniref:sensor histidine kinase n=1 Tax=Nocardioides sp. TaxID=35761 RepID=UPI0039E5CF05
MDRAGRHERSLRRLHVLFQGLFGLSLLLPLIDREVATSDLGLRVALALLQWAVGVDLWRAGERPRQLVALSLPIIVVLVSDPRASPGDASPGLMLGAFLLSAARVLPSVGYLGVAAVSGTVWLLARGMRDLDVVVLAVGLCYGVVALARSMHRGAREADRLQAAAQRRRFEDARLLAVQATLDTIGHVLHDQVLAALRQVADGTGPATRTREVVRSAIVAVNALAEYGAGATGFWPPAGSAGPDSVVSETGSRLGLAGRIRRAAPVGLDVRFDGPFGDLPLSSTSIEALERAVGEALRNVARHSGARTAVLRARVKRDVVTVDVVDQGRGLPVDFTPGFGLRRSVEGPVERAGGMARIAPTPGGGTTVSISLPGQHNVSADTRRIFAEAYRRISLASGDVATVVRPLAWALGLVCVIPAVHNALDMPRQLGQFALIATYSLSLVVLTRVSAGMWSLRRVLGVWTWTMALQSVGLVLMDPGALSLGHSWSVTFTAALVSTAAVTLPVGYGVALVASHLCLVSASSLLAPSLAVAGIPWSAVNPTVMPAVAVIVLGWLLRRLGGEIEAATDRLASASLEMALHESAIELSSLHLDHTRRHVVPWLSGIVDGTIDLTRPETRERARLLAAEVRDDLYVPGFYDDSLRRQVTRFRSAGGVVELRTGLLPGGAGRALGRLVGALTSLIRPEYRLVVLSDADQSSRVSVMPPLGVAECARVTEALGVPVAVQQTGLSTVLRVEGG